ncbi:SGNH/GDSL hydrolase family protein [Stenotrophomonas sp. PS02298]|uniref:SGNH/GDSL hydrolase family protein n=1 Tax=Stenotrophomonas sp. PS02298 TaxID=2991424 RepID=UPI00249C6093|nr:SGNH/GDSL hydrolase family protein [Stenotrophomonas sp. PS02298]
MVDMNEGVQLKELDLSDDPSGAETYGEKGGRAVRLKVGVPFGLAFLDALGGLSSTLMRFLPSGVGGVSRQLQDKAREMPSAQDYGAAADGSTNDTAAFTKLEAAVTGRVVDLGGKTFVVSQVPTRNFYTNGYFKSGGAIRPAGILLPAINPSKKAHYYGGQLRKLASALTDPLHQAVYVTLAGDSITWGATLPENSVSTPRTGTLGDPRDNYVSPSFANEFKRHIGREYFDGIEPVLSNWSYSPSGQSTAEFRRNIDLYPGIAPFTVTLSTSATVTETDAVAAVLGKQYRAAVATGATVSIKFPFTGDKLELVYSTTTGNSADYQIYVDGALQGQFSTTAAEAYGVVRSHDIPYVRNKEVEIRVVFPSGATASRTLYLEAIRIPKVCRITTQGIIGSEFFRYAGRCFGQFGPSILSMNDEFFIVQLGTNNRGAVETPTSVNRLKNIANALVDLFAPAGDVVLMCANPADPDGPAAPFKFRMSDVRSTLQDVARSRSLDFVDNYAVFRGTSNLDTTADGLHPNALGHALIARNLISALEGA